jgi:hypothetical protein
MRPFIIAIVAGCLPLGAYAHQGFASAGNGPVMRITAPIEGVTYDGGVRLNVEGQSGLVSLATPAQLKSKGVPFAALTAGKEITVDAYDIRSDESDKLYAKRLLVDGQVLTLR